MTSAPDDRSLQSAEAILAGLSDRLISGGAVADFPSLLAEVRSHMQAAQDEIASSNGSDESKTLVRSIRAKVLRVQTLFDSAALFHCGSLYARPSSTGSYTADGSVDLATPSRRFDFEV